MRSAEAIVSEVFDRWKREVTTAWADGMYTPNEDQFREMAEEAVSIVSREAITVVDRREVPLDVWLLFDHEDDEESSHEANTFLTDDNKFRVDWSNTSVGQITSHEFETYEAACVWLEEHGYTDYSS